MSEEERHIQVIGDLGYGAPEFYEPKTIILNGTYQVILCDDAYFATSYTPYNNTHTVRKWRTLWLKKYTVTTHHSTANYELCSTATIGEKTYITKRAGPQ